MKPKEVNPTDAQASDDVLMAKVLKSNPGISAEEAKRKLMLIKQGMRKARLKGVVR